MAKIYERAELVHVWLGPDENNCAKIAFGLIRRLRDSFEVPSLLAEFTEAQNKNVEQFVDRIPHT